MNLLSDAHLLARLVGYDSTSHRSNLPIADFVCDYLDRPGIRLVRHPSPDGRKTNLVFWVGPTALPDDRRGLTLCGHLDVVPAEEPEWTTNPFELVETESTYIGRGACDMKGFVAVAINALASADQSTLSRPLALLLTYDEEVGTLGARHFAKTWPFAEQPLPKAMIVGEPTSLRPIRMHKGHCRIEIEFHGQPAHSGYPHLGLSAIEPAAIFVDKMARLRNELEDERAPSSEYFPEVPFVALNIARIDGGEAINIIPERCRVDLGFRVLPGMEIENILGRIETDARHSVRVNGASRAAEVKLGQPSESPPLLLPEDSGICTAVCELSGISTAGSASYATDAGWLQQAGFDCLIYGPGTIEVAHKPNESIPKEELRTAAESTRTLISRFCRS